MRQKHGTRFQVALLAGFCLVGRAASAETAEPPLPGFLRSYYLPLLKVGGTWLSPGPHQTRDMIDQYSYASSDQAVNIIIGNLPCAASVCETVFNQLFQTSNLQATKNSGAFRVVTPFEYRAEWKDGFGDNFLYVLRLSNSLLIWNYNTRTDDQARLVDPYFDRVRNQVNRQRYETALADGNVEMGRWDVPIRDYAEQLLAENRKQEALAVLRNVVATSPTDYLAQTLLATNTDDLAAARNGAEVVFRNAEEPELIAKSARILRQSDPATVRLPVLGKGEQGLQVVLIPLSPCDIGLLAQASEVYTGITKIPVKILRLADRWEFGPPDRVPNQRQIQQFIVQHTTPGQNFTGWTLERYKAELTKISQTVDAVTRYSLDKLISSLNGSSGQYSIDAYLDKFADILAKYRSSDRKTLYVGITEADISSGDANFLFSLRVNRPEGYTSILSYHMMLSKSLNEPYQSRPRLAERIAKELVPATLGALDIPRPNDPADPYSYSSGVDRLDQKTLKLSKPTEEALAKFR